MDAPHHRHRVCRCKHKRFEHFDEPPGRCDADGCGCPGFAFATLREKMQEAMDDCPACGPGEANEVPDGDVAGRAASHGVTPERLADADVARLLAAYTASGKAYPAG